MMKTKARPTAKWDGLEEQKIKHLPSSPSHYHAQPAVMAGWQVDRHCNVIPVWRRWHG
jgi:hypothetical protein